MNLLFSPQPPVSRARTRRAGIVTALSVAVFALTACGDSAPETPDGPAAPQQSIEVDVPVDVPVDAEPDAEAPELDDLSFPSCEVVQRQVGAGLEALELATEEEHTAEGAMDSSSKTCVWLTEMYEDLQGADANTLMEAVHTGALTMSINVAPYPLSEEDAAAAGFHFHDLRAERAGGYVFAQEDTDLTDPLGIMGVTVSVDRIDVTWGGGTYFDGQGDEIAESFNKDWGIDAAVTVHRLIWE